MPDLATQITKLVDSAAPPVDIDALVQQLEVGSEIPAFSSPSERRWVPDWVVAVGAAMAVVVLIGGFALLVGRGADPTLIGAERPSSTAASPPVTSGGWEHVATSDVFGSATLVDGVVAGGPGVVVVGELLDAEGVATAVVGWVSTDGADWEPVDAPIVELLPGAPSRWHLDAGPSGIVLWSFAMNDDDADSRLFFSPDGLEWIEMTVGPRRIHGLAASEQGFITIGDTPGGTEIHTSSDGLVWNNVDAEIPATVGGFHGASGWGNGWIAWGWDCTFTGACDAYSTSEDGFWTSEDGTTWTKLDTNSSVFENASIWDMQEYQGELYAVGDVVVDDESTPAAWVSSDGHNWDQVLSNPDDRGILWGVTAGSDMIIAHGSHSEEALDRPDEVWMSRDGREWKLIGSNDTFGTPALQQLAISGNRIIAGGSQNWDVWPQHQQSCCGPVRNSSHAVRISQQSTRAASLLAPNWLFLPGVTFSLGITSIGMTSATS